MAEKQSSSKTKFVPLFSPEGHDRTAAIIPGISDNISSQNDDNIDDDDDDSDLTTTASAATTTK